VKRFGGIKRLCLAVGAAVVVLFAMKLWLRSHVVRSEALGAVRAGASQTGAAFPISTVRLSSIAGTVLDPDRKPVLGARVCAVYSSFASGSRAGTCADADAQGRYAVNGLPAGSYLITAARAGFVTGSAQQGRPVEVVDETPRTGVDIVLQPGGARVAGLVIDATGGPVPHAAIRGERIGPPRLAVDVEADDAGRFTLWFPPGPMRLSAEAAAYAPAQWSGPAPSLDVRLVLTPGATVRGVVVSSADGSPMPNVEVLATASGSHSFQLPRSSTSSAQGTFDIGGLEPGSYTLVGTGAGSRGELAQPIQLGLGRTIENIRIEVSAAAQVTGRVLLATDQQPCEQGVVTLGPPDLRQPALEGRGPTILTAMMQRTPTFTASVGANGVVRFPAVAQGHYHISVRCSQNVLRDGPRTLDVGRDALSDLTWKVGPGAGLTVLTVDDRDRPVPGAEFFVRFQSGVSVAGNTNDEGRHDVSGELYPGSYEITSGRLFRADPVRVDLGEASSTVTAKLKMAGNASIIITVRARGGAPLDGLLVTAVASDPSAKAEAPAPAKSPPRMDTFIAGALGEGRYRITPLKPGRYEVRVDDGANAAVRGSCTVAAGDATQVSIEIDRGGRIRGHVVDDDGVPVPDVWVSASAVTDGDADRPPIAQRMLGGQTRTLTDPDGRFALDRLTGGDTAYTVRAEQPAGAVAVKQGVRVGDSDAVVVLHAAGTVAGTVGGDCGDPATPVTVAAMSAETGQSSSQELPAPEGSFHLSVSPGHVELMAFCRGGRGMARMTTELSPKENVTGLRLILEAPPLAEGPRLAAPTN
jgi:hypothetical protein